MGAERAKILQMVAEGELTVEEADQLLDAIAEHRGAPARAPQAPVPPRPPVPPVPPVPPLPPQPGEVWTGVEIRRGALDAARAALDARVALGGRRARVIRRRTGERARSNPTFDQLIQLSIHGVDPGFVKQVREAGLEDLTFDEVIQLGIHGISPDYIKELTESFDDLDFDHLVQLAIHGVDPGFVKEVRGAGFGDLSVEQVVQMAIHGVSVETVKGWKEAGIGGFGSEQEDDATELASDPGSDPDATFETNPEPEE